MSRAQWLLVVLSLNAYLFVKANQEFYPCDKVKDKKILITGASKGIGREIALQLSKCEVDIIATGRAESDLLSLKEAASPNNDKIFQTYSFDMLKEGSPKELIKAAQEHFQHIDFVFFSHAHLGNYKHFSGSEDDLYNIDYMMSVNFLSSVRIVSELLSEFKNSKPCLVFFSSDLVENPMSETFAYSLSKSTQIVFANILKQSAYKKKFDVTIVVIPGTETPGIIASLKNHFFSRYSGKSEKDFQEFYNKNVKHEIANVEEVARDIIDAGVNKKGYVSLIQKYKRKVDEL